jgi:ubiquinone/menaquinone biosynthesis C-methylase UbiE
MESSAYEEMRKIEDTDWWFIGKRLFVKTILSKLHLSQNIQILDIGCGTGGMTKFLTNFGNVTGIESNPIALSYSIKRCLTILNASADHLPCPDNFFDVVTLFDVLYHKNINESKALSEAYRVLKKDGTLLITDCVHQWLWSLHDEIMHARCRYGKTELMHHVLSAGFQINKVTYLYACTFPLFILQRMLSKITKRYYSVSTIPKNMNKILLSIMTLESKMLWYISMPFGSSLLILAKKP